ncbi:MAG TPA: hypothetical protein VGC79_08505 [Polyangiaceae bacterium]
MTIENSEDTAHVGVTDPAEPRAPEASSAAAEPVADAPARSDAPSALIETVQLPSGTHDSTPPMSRKLAPPPKPKRDSGAASAPPSGRPPDGPDLLASANALKAPIAPTISFSGQGIPTLESPPSASAEPAAAPASVAPLSQPPPMRRRSNPSFPDMTGANASTSVRTPSDPALPADATAKENANALRPIAAPPRPRSDPPPPHLRADSSPSAPDAAAPPAPAANPPGFPAPSTSPSAIFAMRIIAVGDSVRAPAAGEQPPEIDPDSYPPSASRLGTTVRRSSRPPPAPVAAPGPLAAPAAAPVAAPAPAVAPDAAPAPVAASVRTDEGPSIEIDVPIDVELPATGNAPAADMVAALDAAAAALEASSVEAPSVPFNAAPAIPAEVRRPPAPPPPIELLGDESAVVPTEARRPPAPPPPVELSGDEFSAEAIAKKIAAAEAAEAAEAARAARASEPAAGEQPTAADQAAEELGREDAISMPP